MCLNSDSSWEGVKQGPWSLSSEITWMSLHSLSSFFSFPPVSFSHFFLLPVFQTSHFQLGGITVPH